MSSNSLNVFNTSTLSGSHFTFTIPEYNNLNFNIQTVNLPSVQSTPKELPTPVGPTHFAGDKLSYEVLEIGFIVDESLNDWREIYNWLRALATTNILENSIITNQYVNYDKPLYTSGTLLILTNSLHVNITCNFTNLFPISLTGINFSTKDVEDRKIFANAQFAFDTYDLKVNDIYNPNGSVDDNIIQ
jgi:hypothetical protein